MPAVPTDLTAEKGLPSSPEAERLVLGSILLNDENHPKVAAALDTEDYSLEKHKRIWLRMKDLHEAGERIDRITVAHALMRTGQLESVDGVSYLSFLDQGLPELPHIDSYIEIVKEHSRRRQLIFIAQRTINQATLGVTAAAEIATAATEDIHGISIGSQDDGGRTPGQVIEQFPGGINAFLDPNQQPKGLKTGFYKLDEMTEGLHGGELIILGARPSVGKTALALNIAHNLSVVQKHRGAIFSLEMNAASLMRRMMCSAARVDAHKFRLGFVNKDERARLNAALFEITESPLIIFDRYQVRPSQIIAKIRELCKSADGLKYAMIDYLQIMADDGKAENRNVQISRATREMKLLTGACDIPVLLLSQLSRANEKRPSHEPQLSDLRDSGSIEQDADSVFFLHREEVYKRDREDIKGLADLIISKQRNGPIGRVHLRFLSHIVRFESRAEDGQEEFAQ